MATDWIADVKKYAPKADDAVLEKMLKTYQLVLSKQDSALVSFSDADLDKSIKEVGEKMKDGSRNGRLAVYYLLAEKHNKLGVFK